MPRKQNPVPKYSLHKPTDQAFVRIPNGSGGYSFIYLGRYGTDESREEYERVLAESRVGHSKATRKSASLVNEVLVAFLRHADKHYRRRDGTRTREFGEFVQIAGFLRRLYGRTPAADFGPLALKAVREQFIGSGWCRRVVNRRTNRVRHIFKWAAAEELVPGTVWQGLRAVDGLRAGRSVAPETEPIAPVSGWVVRATLPYLTPTVRAMVELQLLTGMRPGEVIRIRPAEVDRSGDVWVYRPHYHKLTHQQKARAIAIGPRAQAVLEPFTPADPEAFFFSPRLSVAAFHAARTEARVTPLYHSHAERNRRVRVSSPKRGPSARYSTTSYDRAVAKAVKRANRLLVEAAVDLELHVPHWHPNQLRHSHGTEVRRRFGLEAAQVALGHERADVTQVYAERNLDLAVKVAAEVG